jgi:hypothetical protein
MDCQLTVFNRNGRLRLFPHTVIVLPPFRGVTNTVTFYGQCHDHHFQT